MSDLNFVSQLIIAVGIVTAMLIGVWIGRRYPK